MATACCIEQEPSFFHVILIIFSKTLQYLDMRPSTQSSSVLLFKSLLVSLNLFDWVSIQHYVLLHRQIISVQLSSSLNRPNSCLLRFFSLVQQVRASASNSPIRKGFHPFIYADRIQSSKSCSDNDRWSESVLISSSLNFVTAQYLSTML